MINLDQAIEHATAHPFDEHAGYGENNGPIREPGRGIEAMERSILDALGEDAPTDAKLFWGNVMGGSVLRIDLADMAADRFIAAAFVHESEVNTETVTAALRASIYLNRGEFSPEDGFLT